MMAPESRYTYRFIKDSSWGIFIQLMGEVVPFTEPSDQLIEVEPDLYLSTQIFDFRVGGKEEEYLKLGLRIISSQIRASSTMPFPLIICLKEIRVLLTDYQAEGLACAMIGWAAQTFGFEAPVIPVHFDQLRNCYVFEFPLQS
jgi:hypothetical protein